MRLLNKDLWVFNEFLLVATTRVSDASIGRDWQLLTDFHSQFYPFVVDLYYLNLLPEIDKIATEI